MSTKPIIIVCSNQCGLFILVVTCSASILAAESQTRIIKYQINEYNRTEGILEVFGDRLLYFYEGNVTENYRNAKVACKDMGR